MRKGGHGWISGRCAAPLLGKQMSMVSASEPLFSRLGGRFPQTVSSSVAPL